MGNAVALSGPLAAVGADGVFRRSAGVWSKIARLAPSEPEDVGFGRSVALDAELFAVGPPYSESGRANSGSAYLFQARSTGWEQVAVDYQFPVIAEGATGTTESSAFYFTTSQLTHQQRIYLPVLLD
ncbi:MAG: hypothetical protein HC822_20480 [Oscillochloris sp.]|nr:hypothetical protein [Oscillochloris sp.]